MITRFKIEEIKRVKRYVVIDLRSQKVSESSEDEDVTKGFELSWSSFEDDY